MNRNSLLEFKRLLAADSTISVTTKGKYLIVAKVFVQQLYRLGILTVDISSGVKSFRSTSGNFKRNGFTNDEVATIIAGLNESKDIRQKALISLKLFSGLRDCELTRLMVEHVNLTDGMIQVHGKNRDGLENLPLVPQVIHVLRDYLKITKKKSGHLFTSESKRNAGKGLTTKSVWLIARTFLDSLGIHRKPHTCRSFFCSELVRAMGDNLFSVLPYSRHRSIQTLQAYVDNRNRVQTIPKYQSAFSEFVIN